MSTRGYRGFTLVELLVVIGIIALLISILLPALSKARQSASSLTCLSRLRQMGQGILIYAQNSGGTLPYSSAPYWKDNNSANGANPAYSDWSLLITGAMRGGSGLGSDSAFVAATKGFRQKLFLDSDTIPSPDEANHVLDYSCHPRLIPAAHYWTYTGSGPWPQSYDASTGPLNGEYKCYKAGRIQNASEIIMLMDGTQVLSSPYNASAAANSIDSLALNGSGSYLLVGVGSYKPNQSINGGTNRDTAIGLPAPDNAQPANIRWRHLHDTSANFLFADGHAEARKYKSPTSTEITQANIRVNRQP